MKTTWHHKIRAIILVLWVVALMSFQIYTTLLLNSTILNLNDHILASLIRTIAIMYCSTLIRHVDFKNTVV